MLSQTQSPNVLDAKLDEKLAEYRADRSGEEPADLPEVNTPEE